MDMLNAWIWDAVLNLFLWLKEKCFLDSPSHWWCRWAWREAKLCTWISKISVCRYTNQGEREISASLSGKTPRNLQTDRICVCVCRYVQSWKLIKFMHFSTHCSSFAHKKGNKINRHPPIHWLLNVSKKREKEKKRKVELWWLSVTAGNRSYCSIQP